MNVLRETSKTLDQLSKAMKRAENQFCGRMELFVKSMSSSENSNYNETKLLLNILK